jgi:hypothetical protein
VGELRAGWAGAVLAVAVAVSAGTGAACGGPHNGAPAPPGPAGYLAASRSTVAYLHGPAAQRLAQGPPRGSGPARLTGSLELISLSGEAPEQAVVRRGYRFTGRLRGRQVTIWVGGQTAHGTLARRALTIGPLPGLAGPLAFTLAGADRYGQALTVLRDRVRRADTVAGLDARTRARTSGGAAQAAAGLAAVATMVRRARRVVSRQLAALHTVPVTAAAGPLAAVRRDTRAAQAAAHRGAPRVQVCDLAVQAREDALGVSAYSAGMAADRDSLSQALFAERRAVAGLAARLATLRRVTPGQSGVAQGALRLRLARQRLTVVLTMASRSLSLLNADVARAYQLSAAASAARSCGSALAAPAPLRPLRLGCRVTPCRSS